MSNKYNQKLLDSAKKIYNKCNKNCFKQSNSKSCRSCDLIGNKRPDKITKASKTIQKKKKLKMKQRYQKDDEKRQKDLQKKDKKSLMN